MHEEEWDVLKQTPWRLKHSVLEQPAGHPVLQWEIKKNNETTMVAFYERMLAMVNDVVRIANEMDHHPDIVLTPDSLSILAWTHRGEEKVTFNDGILAARFHLRHPPESSDDIYRFVDE